MNSKLKDGFQHIFKFYFALLFFSMSVHAQNTVIKHYGVNQGLPSSETYFVTQDSKGYLWIATDAGVVKYDGYQFKTYTTADGLPDNTVFKIHEDKYGKVWFSTYSGRFAYYVHKTDSVYQIKANDQLTKTVKTLPIDFAFDSKDTLYVSTDRKGFLKIYPPTYDIVKVYQYASNCIYVRQIGKDQFIYGKNFLHELPTAKKIPIVFDDKNDLALQHVDTLFKLESFGGHISLGGSSDKLIFSTGNDLLEIKEKRFQTLYNTNSEFNPEFNILTINKDDRSRVWINTLQHGVYMADLSGKKSNLHFLSEMSVTSTFQDNAKGLWFTTLEDGLFYIPTLDFKFYNKESGFSVDKIHAITEQNNKLLCIASDYSLNEVNLESFSINQRKIGTVSVWNIKTFKGLYVVCGSSSYIIDAITNRETLVLQNRKNASLSVRLKTVEDYDELNLLGCEFGILYKINKKTGLSDILIKDLPTIFSICKVGDKIYLGTKTGVYKYSNNKVVFLGDSLPLLKSRIDHMIYLNNQLFIATKGNGVLIYNEHNSIARYMEREGLASNMAKFLTYDKNGNVWVGTNRGISRLKKIAENHWKVNTINLSEGLVSSEINQLLVHDSLLFFATNKGLGQVNIKEAFNEEVAIPTYIENLEINNVKYKFDSLLTLEYYQNFIQIAYKGVNVKSEGRILYKYRLEGLDSSWTYSENTFVQFTTLPSGHYNFVVYALNAEGQISSKPAEIKFCINAPFWKTVWFYLVDSILLFVLIYIVYKRRIKLIQKQEAEKTQLNKRISESELKALRAQMNPHFMFNAINSIQNFVLKNDSKSAQKYLTKFARLIRSVLENSKHELVWLNREVEALELYIELEALRASFSFDYEVIIDDSLNAENIFIPPMIIQPFIENAILHGIIPLTQRRGKLTVKFVKSHTVLKCIIVDNGIGRAKAEEIKAKKQLSHQSMGMNVTQDRINILNKQNNSLLTEVVITDMLENGTAMGTIVEITINIKETPHD
ncbi:MAG: histidine kinase [Bacteroidota bacterium]